MIFTPLLASIGPTLLASLLRACATTPSGLDPYAASVYAQAQVAVVEHESGADAWAIGDNNALPGQQHSYYPTSYDEAVRIASLLVAHDQAIGGRGIDIGIGQVNSHNLSAHNAGIADALDPCRNLAISSEMLGGTFAGQVAHLAAYPSPVREWVAMDATLQIYNSGRPYGDAGYTRAVEALIAGPFAQDTLRALGVASFGEGVQVSQTVTYVPLASSRVSLGSNQTWRYVPINGVAHDDGRTAPVITNPQAFVGDGAAGVFRQ